jgi:hypothetical protein
MKARAGSGWQTVLADLSLILFMLTAAAVSGAPAKPQPKAPPAPLRGDPVAVWRPGAGAPSLSAWLVAQAPDPRLRLTIVVPYGAGQRDAALAEAQRLAAAADWPARVIVEPGPDAQAFAALTYDLDGLARGLQ